MKTPTLFRAAQILAGVCDGAHKLDGVGFSAFDTDFGHMLAERPEEDWTPRMKRAAWKMLRKYRKQLERSGFLFSEVEEPPELPPPSHRVERVGDLLWVYFPYMDFAYAVVKSIPGRSFSREPSPHWKVPINLQSAKGIWQLAELDFDLPEGLVEELEELELLTLELR